MKVVAVQWASGEDQSVNRTAIRGLIETIDGCPDLVVLPEASMLAFGDAPGPLAGSSERLDGPFVGLLADLSQGGATIVAGMFEDSGVDGRPYNTTVVVARGELVGAYRKMHLYDALGFVESAGISAGTGDRSGLVVVQVGHTKVGILTCFDLRFPELSAALVADGAQVLVLGAAWVPGPRKLEQWQTLLAARAIENTSFVVAAAQPGPRYCGHSSIVGPSGEILAQAQASPGLIQAYLEIDELDRVRTTLPVLSSRRLARE